MGNAMSDQAILLLKKGDPVYYHDGTGFKPATFEVAVKFRDGVSHVFLSTPQCPEVKCDCSNLLSVELYHQFLEDKKEGKAIEHGDDVFYKHFNSDTWLYGKLIGRRLIGGCLPDGFFVYPADSRERTLIQEIRSVKRHVALGAEAVLSCD